MKTIHRFLFTLCLAVALRSNALAADAYYSVSLSSLKLTEWSMPSGGDFRGWRSWELREWMQPYAKLDGEGEVYLMGIDEMSAGMDLPGQKIVVRAPEGKEVTGVVFMTKNDFDGMVQKKFAITATQASPEAKQEFLTAKWNHYLQLQNKDIPGAAWFRYQARDLARTLNTNVDDEMSDMRWIRFNRGNFNDLDDSFAMFSGGRAISENLQLDRPLQRPDPKTNVMTAITNLDGITVRPMDWKAAVAGAKPELDTLSANIPADQHALFFPSFQAMTDLIDEADADGTPVLQMMEPRAEDANTRGRYQKQLCLQLNELSRALGPQLITSAAFTGSDPYLRVGSDVAVLFEAKSTDLVQLNVAFQQLLAHTNNPGAQLINGTIEGIKFTSVVTPDRSVSSYTATVSNVVIVSNSKKQLETLIRTAQGKTAALKSQDEYVFFRKRYSRSDKTETAFLVLSDATIRRWCGPVWRIADARRTRAAAVLADLQAAHFSEVVNGKAANTPLQPEHWVPELEDVRLTGGGPVSSTYGSLAFMTPIAELNLTQVTRGEALSYERWRDTYQQNWATTFDPIAVRFSVTKQRLAAELTVMPLIMASEYNQFAQISRGAQIFPEAGDPHTNALARLAFAINAESKPVKEAGNFMISMAPGLRANPLSWLGQSITLYADEDPFWSEMEKSTNVDAFMDKSFARLPLALVFEVKNALGVTAFLTALRAFADQSAPGMAMWQNLNYNGRPYVKVAPAQRSARGGAGDDWIVYYAVNPDSLTVTMSETLLKRALDRQATRTNTAVKVPATQPWLGSNICFQAEGKLLNLLQKMGRDDGQADQLLAWQNLPILNEWKRLFPDKDPVKLHEDFWGVKLLCPGGGSYVWNAQWHTMESTVYGCPAAPKRAPITSLFEKVANVNVGLNFEAQGLSARAVVNRK